MARDHASTYASVINEIFPNCVQVADRFHLLQNFLKYMKDIFIGEMPGKIYVKDDVVLKTDPEKICC